MTPWYKAVQLRKEVREGRSFSPDEFAIALEQVVDGRAPTDYCDPAQFFSRTCFTRALKEQASLVLRRLAGKTENTASVLTLITQFGGGKTHTLTSLYHLARAGEKASEFAGVSDLLAEAGVAATPAARVGVFVGNAWDPTEGRETPWLDLARQLAGDKGVAALGGSKTTPPGTSALGQVFAAADAPVLLLFDEVLNFINRHRNMADSFHAFIQNLTVAITGTTHAAAVISLPRSQVEMTDWDQRWQERINKVVRRVARDLIANDEAEISEVVRRRLFDDIGNERSRKNVAGTYANWCFERTNRLPPEWTAVDSAKSEAKARDFLRSRFEACYPFHPATLSVFQRKWRALPQFQQTRGTLAMLAQWISLAARDSFVKARNEPLITLGSAPLHIPGFRSVVLGQLGEMRLDAAILTDLAGETARTKPLDADEFGAMRDIHYRVGTAILFESSGGQVDKVAHLPELRFALGEPEVETTTIDNAATALEAAGFFIRKLGTDGYRIHHQATLKKVASDRRASLNEETEIRPATVKLVKGTFNRGASLPMVFFPKSSAEIQDSPKLMLIIDDPELEWADGSNADERISQWIRERRKSPRLYPGSLVWCIRKPGRALRERVEVWLAWQHVEKDLKGEILGKGFSRAEHAEVRNRIEEAKEAAIDELWGSYRFVVLADASSENGLKAIDLGAGHSSGHETLCGRIIGALKSEALLNESVGAGFIARHWPPAFKETGAWPLTSLRQSFLDGSLTRLVDPDAILRRQLSEFAARGEFGLASGQQKDGGFDRLWYAEPISQEEVVFESDVFLLSKAKAEELKSAPGEAVPAPELKLQPEPPIREPEPQPGYQPPTDNARKETLRLSGAVPPEVWNRLGTKILPKLRAGDNLAIGINFSVSINSTSAKDLENELKQILADLDLSDQVQVRIER